MRDGRYLVTEIKGVTAMSLSGSLTWSTPGVAYPSDTNEISADRYLTVDQSMLAQIVIFNSNGKALWMYRPTGAAQLSRPSLALPLADGDIFATDDADRRVLVSTLGRTRSSGRTVTAPLARHLGPGKPRRDGPAFAQRALARRGALRRKYRSCAVAATGSPCRRHMALGGTWR
jgi:hypothetical protein